MYTFTKKITYFTIYSKKFQEEFKNLKDKESIFKILFKKGDVYYSNLRLNQLIWKMCYKFNQVAKPGYYKNTFELRNEDGKTNEDTVFANVVVGELKIFISY